MSTSHTEAVAPQPQVNPGEILRCAREERGLQLSEVANQLNLTSQVVKQLEAGDFHALPGHTFTRGYIRAYAKLLDIDQAALIEAFDRYTGSEATAPSNIKALKPWREPIRLSRIILRGFSGLLLVLLVLAGYSWWHDRPGRLADLGLFGLKHIEVDSANGVTQRHPVDEPETMPATTTTTPAPASTPATLGSLPAGAVELPLPTPAPSTPATQPLTANTAAVSEPPEPAPESTQPALPDGHGLVQIEYGAACWTKVSDVDGKVLFIGVRKKGESLSLSGKAPLDLRLGYAHGINVRYNGAPVTLDIAPGGKARAKLGQ